MEKEKVVRSVINEKIIKELLLKCAADRKEKLNNEQKKPIKDEQIKEEKPWPMPEMVGFYNQASLASLHPITSEDLTIKKLVCSPDLPISAITAFPATAGVIQQSHLQEATAVESTACTICNKMFTSKAAFQAHQRTHGKESEDPYRCDICSKTFAVPARLTRHYRTHTGEKPFRCEFCNKSFSVKENLSVHRRIHTKERPYKCEVCQRAFEHSGKLHRHMRIHTGERPHKCNICAKTFIQSGQLVIHMRTHTGEKPYVCNVCQKGFTCSKQLKVHSRTHTGEKPYSCEICGKSFGYNHVLKLHQVAHYGEKVYKCTICNSTFNSKKSMEAHIKSHNDGVVHPAQPPTPPASNPSSESSCSSSISEKENFKSSLSKLSDSMNISSPDLVHYKTSPIHHLSERSSPESLQTREDEVLYVYSRTGQISPSYLQNSYPVSSPGVELLAAAATAREELYAAQTNADLYLSLVTTPQVFRPTFYPQTSPSLQPHPNLNAGDDIRKRVEEALMVDDFSYSEGEPTASSPCSSPPISPRSHTSSLVSPPASPNPELSIPPKKRMKMIQRSMEQETSLDLSPVRYSVIQYARSS